MALHSQTDHGRTDGEKRRSQDDHPKQIMQRVEDKSEWTRQHTAPNARQNRRPYETQSPPQLPAPPAPIPGTTENATLAHFTKKSMHLRTGPLSIHQVLLQPLNGPQIETSLHFNRSTSTDPRRQKAATR